MVPIKFWNPFFNFLSCKSKTGIFSKMEAALMGRGKFVQKRGGQVPIPIYYNLQMELLKGIEGGKWSPGEAIPPERKIAEDFGVSLGTVNRALANLVTEGYLQRIRGKGTFVAGTTIPLESVRYTRLRKEFGNPDPRFKIKLLNLQTTAGFQPANRFLKIKITTKLWKLTRLFQNRKNPLIYYVSYLPQNLFPNLNQIAIPILEKMTLYEAIEKKYGLPTIFNQELFSAVPADGEVANVLHVSEGVPVLRIEMLSFTYKEKAYEYRKSYCVTDELKMYREM
jgi:GntR family transcriptional regulator